MGVDGGYVRDCRPRSKRSFEVIVGRILGRGTRSRSLGFVRRYQDSRKSRRRIRHRARQENASTENLTVFTGGDISLRELQLAVVPEATHILDWWHLTRQIAVIKKILLGENAIKQLPAEYHDPLVKALKSLKWRLWHGRHWRATRKLGDFLFTLRLAGITNQPVVRVMRRLAKRLLAFLKLNEDSLPNYGKRYRAGERVASSFVESAVNQLIDKRMSKSQQMPWSHAGAHMLLQVRAEIVDGRLDESFERWYPGFGGTNSCALAA